MKKSILIIAVSTFITVVSCNSPVEKVKNAQEDVAVANVNLDKANQEYIADILNYRKEVAQKIEANNTSIVEFKARIEHEKKETRAEYNKKMEELEMKNSDAKKKMDEYNQEGKENWEKFKTEFSHDMDELGKAFKDLTVKNTK